MTFENKETDSRHSSPDLKTHRRFRRWTPRYSAMELLIALIVMFVLAPFVQDLPHGRLIDGVLMTVVLVSAVFSVGARRRTRWLAGFLVVPALAGRWMHHFRPDLCPGAVFVALGALFVAFVILHLLRFVVTSRRVNREVLCASISAYLLLGLAWALAYTLVAELNPAAFALSTGGVQNMDSFNAFYFSFVTLSTVGYGDITPVSPVARMLAVMEAVTGLFYVAVLIARLVSLHASAAPPEQSGDS